MSNDKSDQNKAQAGDQKAVTYGPVANPQSEASARDATVPKVDNATTSTDAGSPLPPAAANPTPAAGTADPHSSQPTADAGLQPTPATAMTPNMASTPSSSVLTPAVSGSAPKVVPAETRGDGRPEGGIVLVNEDVANAQNEEAAPGPGKAVAELIRQQLDIITMRIYYDTQELMRVGALAPDVVNLRTTVLTLANAIEHDDRATFAFAFGRSGRGVSPQINDQVIPFHSGMQIGALIDGILRDTINGGFKDDKATRDAGLALLDQMTEPAYPALLRQPAYLEKPLAPRI